jgi:hypothetical protein
VASIAKNPAIFPDHRERLLINPSRPGLHDIDLFHTPCTARAEHEQDPLADSSLSRGILGGARR